ncbi:MAG: OmpA family protein [Candidatus Cloacimonetes bacterium]|nr:OmpA family protein [Candidatus Cloacimonadota bacterium]
MNKFLKLALLMTLLIVSASALFALNQTVGVRYGLSYPITDQGGTDRIHPMYGLSWEAWMSDHFSVGLYPYLTNLEKVGNNDRFKAQLIGADVMLKYRPIHKAAIDLKEDTFAWLSPFGAIGLGAAQYTTKGNLAGVVNEFDESKLAIAPSLALGMSLVTTAGVSVDLGGQYVYTLDDEIDMVDDGGSDGYFMPWLGFNLAFGNKKDTDGDGIIDSKDGAPNDPEDFDGYQDSDGIPDLDNDKDGIPDVRDGAPMDPEDRDGFQDNDGIPDLDNDKDGIPDSRDGAPNDPEDFDGVQDSDGIPDIDLDRDKDGIPDSRDGAPDDPEDKDSFQDMDGIPDLDNDADGILDRNDKAPGTDETVRNNIDTKENYNEFEDTDGVPDVKPVAEQPKPLLRDRISMEQDFSLKGVQFEIGSANLTTEARNILQEVVEAMKANPNVKVEIQGHTDNTGGAAMNKKLSEDRAASVKTYMVNNGIAADRMTTSGFGYDKPIATNDTVEGRTENRRIEFHIVK